MKTHHGFALTHALLFVIVAGIVGFTGWYVYDTSQKSKDSLESASTGTFKKAEKDSSSDSEKIEKSEAIPSDWATYAAPLQEFSIRYPKDWMIESESARVADSAPDEKATITSPSGVKISYIELAADPEEFPEVSTCGMQAACGVDVINGIDKFFVEGKGEIQLIKVGNSGQIDDGMFQKQPNDYAIHLHMPSSEKSTFKLGENRFGSNRNGYNPYFKVKGKAKDWIGLHAYFSESYNNKTVNEVFNSEDAKTAEKILRSIRFN